MERRATPQAEEEEVGVGERDRERSTTLQRTNAFAIKKRYYETLPNTDEVP